MQAIPFFAGTLKARVKISQEAIKTLDPYVGSLLPIKVIKMLDPYAGSLLPGKAIKMLDPYV